jgi:lipopolysaccharide export system ATP-binding protein
MIETEGLAKSYHGRAVVDQVSLTMNRGEVVGLLGPNGAGKTTTFYMIVGLIRPEKGVVRLDGVDITRIPMHRRARLGLGYLPQETSIFKKLTVEENLTVLWEIVNTIPRESYKSRVEELLSEMGLLHVRNSRGVELSGGEKRRVEIVRALATNPAYILLDEPFAGIDPIAVREIQDIIIKLKARGLGIIITDHNVRETLRITDRTYILHEGKVLTSGTPREIADNPIARKYYLGDQFQL